jgi:hypothetical protein
VARSTSVSTAISSTLSLAASPVNAGVRGSAATSLTRAHRAATSGTQPGGSARAPRRPVAHFPGGSPTSLLGPGLAVGLQTETARYPTTTAGTGLRGPVVRDADASDRRTVLWDCAHRDRRFGTGWTRASPVSRASLWAAPDAALGALPRGPRVHPRSPATYRPSTSCDDVPSVILAVDTAPGHERNPRLGQKTTAIVGSEPDQPCSHSGFQCGYVGCAAMSAACSREVPPTSDGRQLQPATLQLTSGSTPRVKRVPRAVRHPRTWS